MRVAEMLLGGHSPALAQATFAHRGSLLGRFCYVAPNWMTDWSEAARQPWKARLLLLVPFALIGLMVCALAGDLHPWWVPCRAVSPARGSGS